MARLSIGSQHFQAKERKPILSIEEAKVCAPEVSIENAKGWTEPKDSTDLIDSAIDKTGADLGGQGSIKYAEQNRMLAVRNSELATKNVELLAVIEDLELQVTRLKHALDQKQSGVDVDKLVALLETNHSQVLHFIQTGQEDSSDKRSLDGLNGVVSTSTPNTSKVPNESSNSLLVHDKAEALKASTETSSLSDLSFNARAESTPNAIREPLDESSTSSADMAMFEDRSSLEKTPGKSLVRAQSLENILDSVESGRPEKRQSSSPQEQDVDPLEYFSKRRALDTRARVREQKLQPARSIKLEVKNENDDAHNFARKGTKDTRKPLSAISSNVSKRGSKNDGIFDFVEKSELLKNKPYARERRA